MSRILIRLLLFILSGPVMVYGQCPNWSNSQDCGPLNAQGGICNSNTVFCAGDSVGIENTTNMNVDFSYICWDDGTIETFTGNFTGCRKHKYQYPIDSCIPNGTGQIQKQIRLGIKKTCGNLESFHFIITPVDIKFKPKVLFGLGATTACVGTPITITNSSCPNSSNPTYLWDFGDGTTSTFSSPGSHTYNAPGTYTVSLTITNSCGTSTGSSTITILPPTVVNTNFSGNTPPPSSPTNFCTPVSFSPLLNAQNANSYSWTAQPASGININQTTPNSPTINITSPGTYTVSLASTGCCTSPLSDCSWDTTFSVGQGPGVTANPLPSYCNTASLNPSQYFAITSNGQSLQYQWNFPGGNPASSNSNPPGIINYSQPGSYQIDLTITGSCGTSTVSSPLVISPSPVLNVSPISASGCGSLTVNYTNANPSTGTYTWTANGGVFVSGTTATSPEPSILFSSPGFYTVLVSVNSPGCPPVSNTLTVQVGQGPNLTQIQTLPDICDTVALNLSSYFSLIPSTSDSGYKWMILNATDTTYSYTGVNPTFVTIQDPGQYIVSVSVWNHCDTVLLVDTFTYSPPAVLTLPNDTTLCRGSGLLALTASPSTGSWTLQGVPLGTSFDTDTIRSVTNHLIYSYGALTCAVQDTFSVTVVGAGTDAGPDRTFCSNSPPTTFTGAPAGGIWSGVGITNTSSGDYDPGIPVNTTDTVVYTYVETGNGYSCTIRDTLLVTIYQPSSAVFTIPDTACVNTPVLLENNTPNTTSVWDPGDNSGTYTSNSLTHTYSASGSYTVSLLIDNPFGCQTSVSSPIEIINPPDASFTMDIDTGCAQLPVTFTNSSSNIPSNTYTWDFGNGVMGAQFNPGTVVFDQLPGDSTVYVISLNAVNGCGSATYSDTVVVYPIPVVEFGFAYNDSCSPALIQFNNVTTGQPESYSWYINGVFVSNDTILNPQVFTADSTDSTYTVSLVSTNHCGQDSVAKDIVIRPNQVTAFFNADKVFGCRPLTCTFTSIVAASSVVNWDFGDGNTANGNVVTHTFDTAGIFTVKQFVDNLCGFDSISQTIEVLPQPLLDFSIPPVACDNETVSIENLSPGLSASVWALNDSSWIDSTNYSPSHVFSTPGQYLISLIGYASGTGCSDTISKPIHILPHPTADFSITNPSGCVPLTVNLTSTSSNAAYYYWIMGTSDTIVGNSVSYTYLDPGQYSMTLIVLDTNLCQDDTTYNFINVFPIPDTDFDFTQTPICTTPTLISFTNQSTGASGFNWTFSGLGQSTTQDPVLSVNVPDTITATLTSQNIYGCTSSKQKNIKVYGNPTAGFSPLQSQGCNPLTVFFNSTSANASSSIWFFGTGDSATGNPVSYTYIQPGSYSITMVAHEDSVCFDTLTVPGGVTVQSTPVADFSFAEVDTLIDPSGIYQFTNASTGAIRWEWDFGDGSPKVDLQNPVHQFSNNGVFIVTLIAYSADSCSDIIRYTIEVDYLGSLFIPNAFSPDAGTDETRYFIPRGVGLAEFKIEVFSPYGEKVWASTALSRGQPTEKWDGTFLSKPLPQGAYVWKVEAVFQNGQVWKGMSYEGEKPKKVGSVMIVR